MCSLVGAQVDFTSTRSDGEYLLIPVDDLYAQSLGVHSSASHRSLGQILFVCNFTCTYEMIEAFALFAKHAPCIHDASVGIGIDGVYFKKVM